METITAASRPRPVTHSARLLWLLTALFCLRVLGQILVELWQVSFLPPSEKWLSGLLPYPWLLASQVLIIGLLVKICFDFTRQTGWTYRPSHRAGVMLLAFGLVYLAAMIARYAIRMSLYPQERWTGGLIPIFFHWVLAACVLIVAAHHLRLNRTLPPCEPGHRNRPLT